MIIDGKKIKDQIKEELKKAFSALGDSASLGIVLVGEDPASEKFVSLKQRFGEDVGVDVWLKILPETTSTERVIHSIENLETDGVVEMAVLASIPKEKDVDVLNGGEFDAPVSGAVFEILNSCAVELSGKSIVVVGEGKLVGLPVTDSLKKRGLDFTVVNIETPEEEKFDLIKEADVIISGAGDPHFIKEDMIKEGVVIIDAGTSEKAGKLEGDVDPACANKASLTTPVPGGVGPVTVAILFKNLLKACLK
jgi:methylenetetrahydrofolate dehydrogenase (NADP+)/methenyltetrahydrofolate cyclohydrolase